MRTESQVERLPLLLIPEQASKVDGLGVNRIRQFMEDEQFECLLVSNRKLMTIEVLQGYYQRAKIAAT